MSLDVGECFSGLQNAYCNNDSVQVDDLFNLNKLEPEVVKRASIVEETLLELVKLDEFLDEEEATSLAVEPTSLQNVDATRATSFSDGQLALKDLGFEQNETEDVSIPYTVKELPTHPSSWPQKPVMLRSTPNTSTKILGIRRASKGQYEHFPGFSAGSILPINTGSERPGESLVIDFESTHFFGTLLMRIEQCPPSDSAHYQDESYFDGKQRKFQSIVKGRFKHALSMSECVTGQTFNRPAGKLPAQWVVTAFIKFISTLAPQLEATLEGDRPRFLTPLVATTDTVLSKNINSEEDFIKDMEEEVEEPSSVDEYSVMQDVTRDLGVEVADTTDWSVAARMKARKKAFNSVSANKENLPQFAIDKEYTFEFYEHMLDFGDELALNMGYPIGKIGLAQATDGQPLKFASAHKDPDTGELDSLWSFDIFHESLFPYAESALGGDEN